MLSRENASKLDELIKVRFPIIYDFKFDGIVLLYGGAIKNIIMDTDVHDLDFVILTQGECQILEFIYKFKLKYTKNAGGGYKIFYNNFTIDICSCNDLQETAIYDIDLLFYDIEQRLFIGCGVMNAIENRTITEVNDDKNPLYSNKRRVKKLIKFVKYVTNSNKRVKVKQNKLLWEVKMLKRRIKVIINKTINGNFRRCFNFLSGCKKEFSLVIVMGIIISLIAVIFPTFSGRMITEIMKENYKGVISVVLIMTFLKVFSIVLSYFLSKLYLIVRKKMIFNIRKKVASCVLNFEMENFANKNRGIFIDKLKSDPNEIARTFNDIKEIILNGIGNFGVLLYIFYLDYRIGLMLFFFFMIVFQIRIYGIRKRKLYRERYFAEQERYTGVLGEMVNGVNDIKGLDLKDNYIKRVENSFEQVGENEYKGEYYRNIYDKLAYFVQHIAVFVVLLLGLYLVKQDMMKTDALIIVFMYNSSVFSFLEKLGKFVGLFSDLNVSCDRIFSLLDNNGCESEFYGDKYHDKCNGKIEFNNVSFGYNSKKEKVLKKCNFIIYPNETVAIVGKSGEGKTTLLNLISRLYSVTDGNIKIDDIDIREYNEKFIKENISVISQSPYLFDMSIKDNLRLVKDDITDEEIESVCRIVCMDEFIHTLPNKYDTVIGEGGVMLSGGQKQRIGIARALIKNTKIILLDEITSALDNENASIIKKVIKNIKKEHTIIIVTHELSMIKDGVRILVLSNGEIVGDGTHTELLNNNDIYKKIYKIK